MSQDSLSFETILKTLLAYNLEIVLLLSTQFFYDIELSTLFQIILCNFFTFN